MTKTDVDVLIVGAGLSGIGAAVHLQKNCPGKTYAVLEGRAPQAQHMSCRGNFSASARQRQYLTSQPQRSIRQHPFSSLKGPSIYP